MSGIEAVGLVLGLWPVLKNLAEAYKSSKDESIVKQLGWTIATNEQIFKQSVARLLQGDEELPDKDRLGLTSGNKDFAAIWENPAFNSKLKKRLGDDVFAIVQHETQEIFGLMDGLRKKIDPNNGDSHELQDTRTWGTSGTSGSSRSIVNRQVIQTKFKTFKLSLQKDDIKKSLENLQLHINQLRTLLEPYSSTVYSASERQARPIHNRSSSDEEKAQNRKRADAQYFNDLYEVLSDSFHCTCGTHEASLRLSDSLEVFFPVDDSPRTMSEQINGLRARSLTLDSQVTNIQTPTDEGEDNTSEMIRTAWSRSRKHSVSTTPSEQRALQVLFSQNRLNRNATPIGCLCQWLKKVGTSPPNSPALPYPGIIGSDSKKYTVKPKTQDLMSAPKVMSMDDCLSSCDSYGLSRRTRLDLAMNLASAIVQLYPTGWIDVCWTWRNFSMMRGDTTTVQLCITRRFYSHDAQKLNPASSSPSKFWKIIRDKDPLLVRLGFALIELALGKRLADAAKSGADVEEPKEEWMRDLQDWNTANDLVENNIIRDEVSHAYQSIVAACLEGKIMHDTGMKPLKSGTETFEDDVEKFVVGPLRKYNTANWGTAEQLVAC